MNPTGALPPGLAGKLDTGGFTASNLIAGLIFSSIGFVAFSYGKKQGQPTTMIIGGVLMAYCYFTPTALWTWLVGVALTAALFFWKD